MRPTVPLWLKTRLCKSPTDKEVAIEASTLEKFLLYFLSAAANYMIFYPHIHKANNTVKGVFLTVYLFI